jgi:hypothetical protein
MQTARHNKNSTVSIVARPCKKRKDGPPAVSEREGKARKYGPSRQVSTAGFEGLCMIYFRIKVEADSVKKIFVTVSGGCAYVMEETVPKGYELEIIDFDDIEAGDSFPSRKAREYCAKNGLYEPRRMPHE